MTLAPGSFWQRHGYEIGRDLIVALLVTSLAFYLDNRIADRQEAAEDHRAMQQEVYENVRFIRDRADGDGAKPFISMELTNANLAGLDLSCDSPGGPDCSTFDQSTMERTSFILANLSNASLEGANLQGASMHFADFSGAVLEDADLGRANLLLTDLRGAVLTDVDLAETDFQVVNLSGTDLRGLDFTEVERLHGICYDDSTIWPDSFTPPAPDGCAEWDDLHRRIFPASR